MRNTVHTPVETLDKVIENLRQVQDAVYYGRWQEARDVLAFTTRLQNSLQDDIDMNVDQVRGDKVISDQTMQVRITDLSHQMRRHVK